MNATSSMSSMSKETQKALRKALANLFKIHNACSFQQITQDLRDMAREFQAAALCADAPPQELQSIVSHVAFSIQGVFVLKSSPEHPQNDPLRKVIIDLFIAKGPTAKITNTQIVDAAKLQLKGFIPKHELWMVANELCVVQHKPWVWALKGVDPRNISSLDNTNTTTKSSVATTNSDEQGSKAMNASNATSSTTSMSEETQKALPKALLKLFKIHNACSFQQIIQELRDMAREFQAAAMGADAPPQELQSILSQVAFNIQGMFVLKSSPEHLQNDPLRMVIIDLFYAKGPTAKLQMADIFEAAKLHLGWHISFEDIQMVLYELCIEEGKAWVLKGMDRSMKPLCPYGLSESDKVKAPQGMTQWPFKIAKYVGDIEKGGRVLQDVYSTVGGHISQLPDEILECILNKLRLRDAVSASLVSSRWRHLVMTRACLFFDLPNMFKIGSRERTKCVCSEYKDRFVQAVSKFIASYRGTRINMFAVRFCLINYSPHAVFNWIRFAFDLGVEVLDMEFHCEHFTPQVPLSSIPWKFPIELFPSGQPVLKSLLLSNCDVATTFTLCPFSQLEDLRFHHIRLKSHFMWSVLSGLVNLKQLEMKQCELRPHLSLNSLTSLEGLWVTLCFGLEKIDMANLKLKTLSVLCRSTVSLGLTGVPNLKTLSYAVHDGGMCHIFSKLPEILPHLRTLRVDSCSNWMEYMPESITTFSRLRTLTLALDHKVGDIMFKIVQLLKSCPLLCELSIVLSTREDKEHEKLESIVYHHEHLESIEIHGFVGTKYQIESCKYLLKLAPRAKWMILMFALPALLSPITKAGYRSHRVNAEERESAVNALQAVSSDVKVFFV